MRCRLASARFINAPIAVSLLAARLSCSALASEECKSINIESKVAEHARLAQRRASQDTAERDGAPGTEASSLFQAKIFAITKDSKLGQAGDAEQRADRRDSDHRELAQIVSIGTSSMRSMSRRPSVGRIVLWVVLLLLASIVALIFLIAFRCQFLIGKAVMRTFFGPIDRATWGVDMAYESVKINILSGMLTIFGTTVSNPEGYSGPCLMTARRIMVDIDLQEYFMSKMTHISLERLVIKDVIVHLEAKLGRTNLQDVLDNMHKTWEDFEVQEKAERKAEAERKGLSSEQARALISRENWDEWLTRDVRVSYHKVRVENVSVEISSQVLHMGSLGTLLCDDVYHEDLETEVGDHEGTKLEELEHLAAFLFRSICKTAYNAVLKHRDGAGKLPVPLRGLSGIASCTSCISGVCSCASADKPAAPNASVAAKTDTAKG